MMRNTDEMTQKNVGSYIQALRQSAGFSGKEFATHMRDLGFPWYQATVSRVELNHRELTLGEAFAVAELLGIQIHNLCGASSQEAAVITARRRVDAAEKALSAAQADYKSALDDYNQLRTRQG